MNLKRLLDAMAHHGLHPPDQIKQSGKAVRFPGKGKPKSNRTGWYIAPLTGDVVFFGDYSQGLSTFYRDKDWERPAPAVWKKLQAKQRRVEANERQRQADSIEEMKRTWKAAAMDPSGHPYLVDKEIDPANCQVRRYRDSRGRDVLLFPMFVGKQLVGVQRVFANTEKRFWPGMAIHGWAGASNRFGPAKPKGTIYITEGWATGWTIWQATKDTTLVCYTLSNMARVIERVVEKLPGHRIVIAADNDRWSVYHKDGEKPNPGSHHAQTIAADHENIRVAIPDFVSTEDKPTDFDDLRRLEGLDAVRRWLDPDEAGAAVTTPPEKLDDTPEPLAAAPFLVRGIKDGDRYCFVRKDTGAVRIFTAKQIYQEEYLCSLAPASFWETFCVAIGVSGKASWKSIGHYLQQVCERRKVGNHIRCLGVWPDRQGYVVHCGDDLQQPDGEWTKPWLWTGGNYIQLLDDDLAIDKFGVPASVEEARDIHDAICRRWAWKVEASGYLVAGWSLLAPIANCLKWRPHIWINGSAGCGKTELVSLIDALSHFVCYHEGSSTPASIRRELGKENAFSCILDEFEPPKNKQQRTRIFDGLIELIRQCSSGRNITQAKGETTVLYRTSAMFLCASIAGAVSSVQDVRRFSVCELDFPSANDGEYHQWRGNMNDAIDGGLPDRLLARTVQLLRDGTLHRTIKEFRAVFLATADSARQADQLGTLMAGTWLMLNDDPPSPAEAREFVMGLEWDESEDMHGPVTERPADPEAEGRAVLNTLLQTPVVLGHTKEHTSLGRIILDILSSGEATDEHTKLLDQYYIRVRGDRVLFGRQSPRIREMLQESIYSGRWWRLLATLPGARMPNSRQGGRLSFGGERTMCVSLPKETFQ